VGVRIRGKAWGKVSIRVSMGVRIRGKVWGKVSTVLGLVWGLGLGVGKGKGKV
jgi:hypothetical protein